MSRELGRQAFLLAHDYNDADIVMIAGDASFRKYFRLSQGDKSTILMDAPPPEEDVTPFVAVAKGLLEMGYSAPEIIAMDRENGFLLLSDLGDDSFNRLVTADPSLELMLYENAVDTLVDLHRQTVPKKFPVVGDISYRLRPYSVDVLMEEAQLLTQWTMAALGGICEVRDKAFDAAFSSPLQQVAKDNTVISLRDYHVDNLMWLPDRDGLDRVGLLDFQDALLGHPAYDLVSLLQDARRDVSPALEEAMINRFMAKSGIENEAKFRADYAILGAQRNAKIVGIFTRLYMRDGKAGYLPLIPRVWGLLERNLWLEGLAPLRDWIEEYVSSEWRKTIITSEQLQGPR